MKRLEILALGMFISVVSHCGTDNSRGKVPPGAPNLVEISQLHASELRTLLRQDVLPKISIDERAKLEAVDSLLAKLEKAPADSVAADLVLVIALCRASAEVAVTVAALYPGDFDMQAALPGVLLRASENLAGLDTAFNKRYREQSIATARQLIVEFPDSAKSYGVLAHALLYGSSDDRKDTCLALCRRCLDKNPNADFCRDLLKMISGTP